MNYYEELGVTAQASPEEIHQAYRVMARLLHPDNHSDPRVKSASERQMVRLNEILATLTVPEKRRKYDEGLRQQKLIVLLPPAAPQLPARSSGSHWPWALACAILVLAGFWYVRSNEWSEPVALKAPPPAIVPTVEPARAAPMNTTVLPGERPLLRENRRTRLSAIPPGLRPQEHREASAVPNPPVPPPQPAEPAGVLPASTLDGAPASAPLVDRESAVHSQPVAQMRGVPSLSGHWFYARRALDPRSAGLYPPEFIEFFLAEDHGILSGTYRARYQIPDKAVSHEVQFRISGGPVEGKGLENAATAAWASEDGAKGQIKIVLRDANLMEVTWWTSQFGRHTSLASGTAVLVRQQSR